MEIKIKKGLKKHIKNFYNHLGIESILDLKAVTGRVYVEDIYELYKKSKEVFSILNNDFVSCMIFLCENDKKEYNMYIYSTSLNKICDIKDVLKDYEDKAISTIIYDGNKKIIKMLKNSGFIEKDIIKYGYEKRKFRLLKR